MASLEYSRNSTAQTIRITAGIKKYKLIYTKLASAVTIIMGPSINSHTPKTILISTNPTSVENLLMRIPEGVLSKYLQGQWMIASIMF